MPARVIFRVGKLDEPIDESGRAVHLGFAEPPNFLACLAIVYYPSSPEARAAYEHACGTFIDVLVDRDHRPDLLGEYLLTGNYAIWIPVGAVFVIIGIERLARILRSGTPKRSNMPSLTR